MKKKPLLVFLALTFAVMAAGQDSTHKNALTWTGVLDLYYLADFNQPASHLRPGFLYVYNRTGEVNLNLALAEVHYEEGRVRGNLGLMAGSYAGANMAAEPSWLQHVYEANAGVKLSVKQDLWLDAGIIPSHIGFETAINKDNWTMGRSIMAENSPYYESGVRLGYRSEKGTWYLSGLVLNGWQRITRPPANHTPAFGTQVTFTPDSKFTINSSTFIGNDKPDTSRRMRYFHDLFAVAQLSSQVSVMAGFDAGMEQKAKGSNEMNTWYGMVFMLRYKASDRVAMAGRGEWYHDPGGVIVSAPNIDGGFRTWGCSVNLDATPVPHVMWRIECRLFGSKGDYFEKGDDGKSALNASIGTALNIYL
jgi:hypothetical protein